MALTLTPQDSPEQFEAAVLGRECDRFWDSPIGQYLLERTLAEYNTALEEFLICDPTDTPKIIALQSAMKRSASFRDWLSTAIKEGLRAEQIIEIGNE
jgi:hypothetical protein